MQDLIKRLADSNPRRQPSPNSNRNSIRNPNHNPVNKHYCVPIVFPGGGSVRGIVRGANVRTRIRARTNLVRSADIPQTDTTWWHRPRAAKMAKDGKFEE